VEQELTAGLGERQIAEFVEDKKVQSREVIGEPALVPIAGLSLEPVDEIDDSVEPAAGAGPDAASGDGDRQMGLAGAGPADQRDELEARLGAGTTQQRDVLRLKIVLHATEAA
jgi:hypothetical protein